MGLLGLWGALSGWKMLLGYVLANVPLFVDHPLFVEAIQKVQENPSTANIINFVANLLLIVGSFDRLFKNIKEKK